MSLEMLTYVPAVHDALIPGWMERMNGFGMRCEIFPGFSFATHSGFLPFRMALERSKHQELVGVDFLTGFEFAIDDFDLADELEKRRPKPSLLQTLGRRRPEPIPFASPALDSKLSLCRKVMRFAWGSADIFELRMATLSAAVLAELTHGLCAYPADGIWYANVNLAESTLQEVEAYEASLKPSQLTVHRFEKWR